MTNYRFCRKKFCLIDEKCFRQLQWLDLLLSVIQPLKPPPEGEPTGRVRRVKSLGFFYGRSNENIVRNIVDCSANADCCACKHMPDGLEDGRKDAFDDILYVLRILGMIGFHNLLGDVVRRCGSHFAFCHG